MLPREILHDIALFISSPVVLYNFLCTLPSYACSKPLNALKKLLKEQLDGSFASCVWPILDLSEDVMSTMLLNRIQSCMHLFSVVKCGTPRLSLPLSLNPRSKIELSPLTSPEAVPFTQMPLAKHVRSLHVHIWDRHESGWKLLDIVLLGRELHLCKNIHTLTLRWQLTRSQVAFEYMLAGICRSSITHLTLWLGDLSGVVWSADMMQLLTSWMHHNSIRHVDFKGLQMSKEIISRLAAALSHCNALESIVLHDKSLQLALFQHKLPTNLTSLVVRGIPSNHLRLLSHSIANCQVHTLQLEFEYPVPSEQEVSVFMTQCLPTLSKLRVLKISHLPMSGQAIQSMARILPQLRILGLEDNEIQDHGIMTLAPELRQCRRLRILQLENQGCTDNGVVVLANELRYCQSVKELHLNRNQITSNGATVLSTIIHQLRTLDLAANVIQDDGAAALTQNLQHVCVMDNLDLSANPIAISKVMGILGAMNQARNKWAMGPQCIFKFSNLVWSRRFVASGNTA